MTLLFRVSRFQVWHYPAQGTDPSQRREGARLQTACERFVVPYHAVTFDATAICRMKNYCEICEKCLAQQAEKEAAE